MVAQSRPLIEVLGELLDVRSNRGKRPPLTAILVLACQRHAVWRTVLSRHRRVGAQLWGAPDASLGLHPVVPVCGDAA